MRKKLLINCIYLCELLIFKDGNFKKTLYLDQIYKSLESKMRGKQWNVTSTKVDLMSGCISRGIKPRMWEVTNQLF